MTVYNLSSFTLVKNSLWILTQKMNTLHKWIVEDYHQIIESGVLSAKSVELLSGEIVTISPEKPIHSKCG